MKEDRENRIDSFFRDGLENLNVLPSPEIWEHIAENLPHKQDKRKMYIWIAVAASVTLFAAIGGWFYFQKSGNGRLENSIQIASANKNQQSITIDSSQLSTKAKSNNNNTLFENKQNLTASSQTSEHVATTDLDKQEGKTNTENLLPDNKKKILGEKDQLSITQSAKITHSVKNEEKSEDETNQSGNNKNLMASSDENNPNSKTSSVIKKTTPGQEATIADVVITKNNDIPVEKGSLANSGLDIQKLKSIGVTQFDAPAVYGRIVSVEKVIKKDTMPVYDPIFVYEDPNESKLKNRWAIGGQMAPLYSYRNITDVNAAGLSKSSMNDIEKAVITYSTGVIVDYDASSRLSFQTGVYYMKMGQDIDNVSNFSRTTTSKSAYMANATKELIVAGPVVSNSTGTIVSASTNLYSAGTTNSDKQEYSPGNLALQPADPEQKNIKQMFEFIEVPFIAKYKIIDRKINVHLLGGLSTHVLVNNKATLEFSDNTSSEGKTTNVETLNYSSSVGFGVVYKVGKNFFLSVEPTFKYYINSFNSSDAIKLHPYAIGMYSGLSFKF